MSPSGSLSTIRSGEDNNSPGHVRHVVVFACALMAVLLYVDCYCVAMAEPYIKQDLKLSTFQIGCFFSVFFLSYALCQVPAGGLSDRFGSRIMLVIYVLTWSFFTAMRGLSYGFVMLLMMRTAYGIGQAGTYPTSANVLSKWIPFAKRGTASSFVSFGGRLGGAIAPLSTAFLIILWVPVTEESSRFHVQDLLDGPTLCSQLCPPNTRDFEKISRGHFSQTPAAGRVWKVLSSQTQQKIRAIAEEFRPTEPRIQTLKKEGKALQSKWRFYSAREKFQQAEGLKIELTFEQRQLLVTSLNRVLRNKNLYDKDIFSDLELDRCAGGYSKRVDNGET